MKKLLFMFAAMLTVVLVGCSKKNAQDAEPETVKLAVEPNSIISPAFGGDYTLSLTAPEAWTASCTDSWVKVNPTSGNAGTVEISVKISANKESAESSSKIVFKSGDKTLEVPVKRAAKEPARLRVTTEKEIQTPKDGGNYAVKVESNIKWQISSNASWAKIQGEAIKRDNATINIAVDAATAPEETVATITVKPFGEGTEAGEQTVTITRGGTDATSMSISQNEINAPSTGSAYSISVTSTAKWQVYKSWDADWVNIQDGKGEGNGTFKIQVHPATSGQKASTVVTVEEVRSDYYKPVQLNILITREGKAAATLSVDPSSIDVPAERGQVALNILCNYSWTASLNKDDFFSVSTTKGEGNATMVVTVKPTTETKEVTGSIVIKSSYGDEQQTIPVHREAYTPTLELSSDKIVAPYSGTEFTVNVMSNTDWTVSTSNGIVAAVSPASGSGNGSFKIAIASSPYFDGSSVNITVSTKVGGISKQVTVTGAGIERSRYAARPFSVSATEKIYFSPGNLQYQASTQKWRFAEHQYDFVGNSEKGTVYAKNVNCDNLQIATTYTGWIDLFGFGTGNNPTLHTQEPADYRPYTDWGINQITNYDDAYPANYWRMPKSDELKYLIKNRPNADKLYGNAKVNEVEGLVLLPDEWQSSSSLPFTGGALDYSENTITLAKWQQMEALGAVLLPAGGRRLYEKGALTWYIGGRYWDMNNDISTAESIYVFNFSTMSSPNLVVLASVITGCSVRLVRNAD